MVEPERVRVVIVENSGPGRDLVVTEPAPLLLPPIEDAEVAEYLPPPREPREATTRCRDLSALAAADRDAGTRRSALVLDR